MELFFSNCKVTHFLLLFPLLEKEENTWVLNEKENVTVSKHIFRILLKNNLS